MAIVTDHGEEVLIDSGMAGITYIGVGTGTAPSVDTATDLTTELERIAVTNLYRSGQSIVGEALFGASQALGTLTEWGFFSASAGSNTLIAAGSISPSKVKGSEPYLLTVTLAYD